VSLRFRAGGAGRGEDGVGERRVEEADERVGMFVGKLGRWYERLGGERADMVGE